MMKSSLLVFAVVLLAIAMLPILNLGAQQAAPAAPLTPEAPAASTAKAAPATKNPVKPTAESQAKAKSLYQIDCSMCHGDNGNGKTDLAGSMSLTMDDWSNPQTLAGRQDGELFTIIRSGKDKMPPEAEGRASDTEVWNLIIYIRSLSKNSGATAAAQPAK